jgi:hypothetical protein
LQNQVAFSFFVNLLSRFMVREGWFCLKEFV